MFIDDGSDPRGRIVESAVGVFSRYGFRRTTMELLAEAASLSRPALYQHFRNKKDVFAEVARLVGERMAKSAWEAAGAGTDTAERLYAVLSVKLELALCVGDAAHLAELVAEADVLDPGGTGPVTGPLTDVLAAVIAGDPGIDPAGAGMEAREAAELLLDAAAGIGRGDGSPQSRRRRLRHLVDVTVRGLGRHTLSPA